MSLGGFIFGLIGGIAPDQFDREHTWHWAEQKSIGNMSVFQFTGKDPENLNIPGVIYPGQIGMTNDISELENLGNSGKPLILVDLDGWIRGKWSITHLKETRRFLDEYSIPRKIEFNLKLKRYA